MALSWCKVASNLDSHPKIRRAGRLGREVFLFALRRNAEPGNPIAGRLPSDELEPWFLADILQMTEEEAVTGVTAAVTAGLLARDGASYLIVGFDDTWGKAPASGRERTAKWRETKARIDRVTDVTSHNVTESHGDACDAREEKRREENNSAGDADAPQDKKPKSAKRRVERIPERAWKGADYLREQILLDEPNALVSKQPWGDDIRSGWRLDWADEFRIMVEKHGRTYEELAVAIQFVFHGQTCDAQYRYVVQSASALRKKYDSIKKAMGKASSVAPTAKASKPVSIPIAQGSLRIAEGAR